MGISLMDPQSLKGQESKPSKKSDPQKRLQDTIDEIAKLSIKGEKTALIIHWEIGKRIQRVADDSEMGDQVLKTMSKALSEQTGGEDFSLASLSRYRSIYRLVPDKSQVERLADAGVRKTHLYRLAQRDVSAEDQQIVLDKVLGGEITPQQIESEATSRSSSAPTENSDAAVSGDDPGEPGESPEPSEGGSEESAPPSDDVPKDPAVSDLIDLVKGVIDAASRASKRFEGTDQLNDKFDGMDLTMQREVEPYLGESLTALSDLKKSTDTVMNRIRGCI